MKTNYLSNLGATIAASMIASKNGLSYLSAATAMSLAGRPEATFVEFGDKPYLECLNGALVAVDLAVEGLDEPQRMYLPIMDRDNVAKALVDVTVEDVNSNRQRCLVKALATVFGTGMSVYLGQDGDGSKAVKMLGVEENSDLALATPIVANLREKNEPYIEWGVGVAVARVTDPTFFWKVLEWNGKPYREVLGGLMVDVMTVYKGKKQTLSLPILDGAFNVIPADKATTFDWNKTVMRALTKCFAFNSGYGLSVYAESVEPVEEKKDAKKTTAKAAPAVSSKTSTPAGQTSAASSAHAEPAAAATPAASAPEKAAATAAAEVPAAAASAAVAETPAADTAEAAADAAAPTPDAEAPAPVVLSEETQAAVTRFRGVMTSRKDTAGVAGLQTLFEALKVSAKFADSDKPACYSVLISALASSAEGVESVNLLVNLRNYGAMQYVANDIREVVAGRIAANYLAATLDSGDQAVKEAPGMLVEAGVVSSLDDLIRVAKIAGTPAETLDLVVSLQEATA
jgi:Protein of unknown function (DUF1071)